MNFLFVTLALAISLLSLSALFFLAIRAVVWYFFFLFFRIIFVVYLRQICEKNEKNLCESKPTS
jgi:hypothetical protein